MNCLACFILSGARGEEVMGRRDELKCGDEWMMVGHRDPHRGYGIAKRRINKRARKTARREILEELQCLERKRKVWR